MPFTEILTAAATGASPREHARQTRVYRDLHLPRSNVTHSPAHCSPSLNELTLNTEQSFVLSENRASCCGREYSAFLLQRRYG
jgi:hypothetical protein